MFGKRLSLVFWCTVALLLAVCGRLFYLQVMGITSEDPDRLLRSARALREIPAYRGAVLDRHGEIIVADRPQLDLAVHYRDLRYPKRWLRPVQAVTGRPEEELLAKRRRIRHRVRRIREQTGYRRVYEETIAHPFVTGISFEAAARIEADPDAFPGVIVRPSHRRAYPRGNVAPHVIGYAGAAVRPARGEEPPDPEVRPGDRVGRAAAEKRFDRLLRGSSGLMGQGDSGEQSIFFPARPGHAVFLSLDLAAQQRAEAALEGRTGGAVVMDVESGELLVVASSPRYDNTDMSATVRRAAEDPKARILLSRAMQDSVPSGSVIKPVVALAAAAAGKGNPSTTFTCGKYMKLGRRRLRCSGTHGRVDMALGIEKSCNIYFYKLGLRAGPEAIVKMAGDLGFGRRTGVDLPYEWPGRLPDPARERAAGRGWYGGHTCILSIGQGDLQVTPLQVAVAMAAIANGGRVLRPRVFLRAVPDPEPELLPEALPAVARTVAFRPEALRAVRRGMRQVVLTGTARRVQGLREMGVAAKTGTAETPDPKVNHAWIAGFVPWDAPRYAFAVVVHRTPGHGADAAGPVAAAMLDTLLSPRRSGAEVVAR